MSAPKNPAAFPVQWEYADNETGMTLRDWFAGQALPLARASLAEYDLKNLFGNRTGIRREEILAADAYRLADAMLAARGDA